jgi:hypothetical protein
MEKNSNRGSWDTGLVSEEDDFILAPAQSSPLEGVGDYLSKELDLFNASDRMGQVVSGNAPVEDTEQAVPSATRIDLGDGSELVGEPTIEEKAREVIYGLESGVLQGGTTAANIYAGARVGSALMPPVLPVVGPFSKPIGAVAGGITGLTASYLVNNNIDQMFPEVSREDLIPYREGGRTWGETIGSAPVAFAIPTSHASGISRFLSMIGEGARKYPKSYLTGEAIAGAGAGLGAGISETLYPGEAGPRFGFEVGFGTLIPGRILASGAGAIKDGVGKLASSFSAASREGRAANELFRTLEEGGTDVNKLIKLLEAPTPGGIKPTAAQKTGDLGLTILENTLARSHAKYGGETYEQGVEALKAYEILVDKLKAIGDPRALTAAAQLRAKKTEALLSGRLAAAEADAAEKIFKIKQDNPKTRQDIGAIVRSEIERSLGDVRAHEKELWNRAYKGSLRTKTVKGQKVLALKEVNPANTAESFLEIATSMTPERFNTSFPEVRQIMSRLGIDKDAVSRYASGKLTPEYLETGRVPAEYLTKADGKKTVSVVKNTDVQDLINIRSDLLAFARKAAASGDAADANFYGRLAESALDDLASSKNPAYDEARQFSRQLNDFFTRTYAGDIPAVNKRGGDKLPPEILVAKAFGSGNDVTALRMAQVEDAVGMLGTKYDEAVAQFGANSRQAMDLQPYAEVSKQAVTSITDAHSRVISLMALETLDPISGRVKPAELQKFVNKNKLVLDKLGLTEDLSDAVKAETAFKSLDSESSAIRTKIKNQAAFAQVLGRESPSAAIADAMTGRYPVRGFKKMVSLAKSGGPDAVNGLKSAVYDYAFTKASTGNGKFSAEAFEKAFFSPISYGQPSVYNILRSQDAISMTEAKNLKKLINPMVNIERAIKSGTVTDSVVEGADALLELGLRITGAKVGASIAQGGSALVAASAGSKLMRKQFDKIPTMMVRGIIEEATKDPQAMALLLRRGVTQNEKYEISKQLTPFLARVAFGTRAPLLNYSSTFDPGPAPLPEEEPAPTRRARKLLQDFPTAPTRGTGRPAAPNVGAPTQGGTGLPALPASPAGSSSSRKMLQSLFPMDTISAMGAE